MAGSFQQIAYDLVVRDKSKEGIQSFERRAQSALQGFGAGQGRGGKGALALGSLRNGGVGIGAAAAGLGAGTALFAGREFLQTADRMREIESRVRNITRESGDFRSVWSEILDISTRNGQELITTIDTVQRLSFAKDDLGASNEEVLQLVDNVQQLGIISGATQEQMANASLQLTQGLASGVLRAEEFNSIVENAPAIASAIADGLGHSFGEMRKLVVEGKILSKDVFEALLSQTDKIAEQSKEIAVTLPRAMQSVKNEMAEFVSLLDASLGASKNLAEVFQNIAGAIDTINKYLEKGAIQKAEKDVKDAQDLLNDLKNNTVGFDNSNVGPLGIGRVVISSDEAIAAAEKDLKEAQAHLADLLGEGGEVEGGKVDVKPADFADLPSFDKALEGIYDQILTSDNRLALKREGRSNNEITAIIKSMEIRYAAQDDLNKLLEEGKITEEQYANSLGLVSDKLDGAADAYARSLDRLEEFNNTQKAADQAASIVVDGILSIGDASRSAEERILSLAASLAEMIFQLTVLQPLASGISSSLQNFGPFQALANFGGGKASGGSVSPGSWYITGEKGPELFTPSVSGVIHNARQTAALFGGKGANDNGGNTYNLILPNARNPEEFRRSRSSVIRTMRSMG